MRDGEATAGVTRHLGDFKSAVIASILRQVSQQQLSLGSVVTYVPGQGIRDSSELQCA